MTDAWRLVESLRPTKRQGAFDAVSAKAFSGFGRLVFSKMDEL